MPRTNRRHSRDSIINIMRIDLRYVCQPKMHRRNVLTGLTVFYEDLGLQSKPKDASSMFKVALESVREVGYSESVLIALMAQQSHCCYHQ
jgi:hypothetical protein